MSADPPGPVPHGLARDPAVPTRVRRITVIGVVIAILAAEVIAGAPALGAALAQLRAPHWGWLTAAVAAEVVSMGGYARMQRRLLRSAGTQVSIGRHVALAFAAHSLSVTLPGGPVFSTRYNFQQMRRYGASPVVASWCIALGGVLSSTALVLIGTTGAIVAGSAGRWWTLLAYLAAALAAAAAVRAVARHPQWLIRPIETAVLTVNRIRRRSAGHATGKVAAMVDQITAVRIRPSDLTVAAFFAVLNWIMDAVCLWLCCQAVGAEYITATELVIAYCAGMAAASIPLIPGNLGVVDPALIFGLVAGGVTTGSAVAAVVLYRLLSLGLIIAAGWIVWLLVRHRQRSRPNDGTAPLDPACAPEPDPLRLPNPYDVSHAL